MIVEAVACTAAAALFGRGIYHSGILSGWIVRPAATPTIATRPPEPAPAIPHYDLDAADQRLFLEVPTAWWLDPNRWGDNPGWRDDLPRTLPSKVRKPGKSLAWIDPVKQAKFDSLAYVRGLSDKPASLVRCPVCADGGQVAVLAVHGGRTSLYDCQKCGAEFTPTGGETKHSRKARLKREADEFDDLPQPPMVQTAPLVVPYQPKSAMRAVMAAEDDSFPHLPCGCAWETPIHRVDGSGGTYCRCSSCRKWWEPASNSPSGRLLAQGEKVWPANEAGAIPRPNCPSCRRSHPTLNTPIDGSRSFYRCSGCRHEWKAPRDVDDACHHRL